MKLSTGKKSLGVTYDEGNSKWRVRKMINGVRVSLGLYKTLEEAEKVYADANKTRVSLGFLK